MLEKEETMSEIKFSKEHEWITVDGEVATIGITKHATELLGDIVFAELPDGLSDFTVSATRDNTNYDTITLTDEGYSAGSSGIKIFSGSTPLTGAAGGQPQVQLRWKIVGTSLSNSNKIHGVALQWT